MSDVCWVPLPGAVAAVMSEILPIWRKTPNNQSGTIGDRQGPG